MVDDDPLAKIDNAVAMSKVKPQRTPERIKKGNRLMTSSRCKRIAQLSHRDRRNCQNTFCDCTLHFTDRKKESEGFEVTKRGISFKAT